MRFAIVPLALTLLSVLSVRGSSAPLNLEQMRTWKIVCDPAAIPSEKYAAQQFQLLYKQAVGTELPIVTDSPSARNTIAIGMDAAKKAGMASPSVPFTEETLRIKVGSANIAIDGGRPRGTLYGVYEFFEEKCGARYLTYDDTYFPEDVRTREVQPGTQLFTPQFAFRWSYYGETNQNPEFAARLHTNTVTNRPELGGITGYQLVNHCVAYLVPPAIYGKTHPEYYAEVGGKRIWDTTDGGGPQLCLTNPQVRDVVIAAVEEEIKKNPDRRNINIAQMDNANYCTCPACKALDEREGSHAGTMISFVNSVAEVVEKKHPNVLLSTFAYWYTRKPPKTVRPRHNVMVQLCSIECCTLHAIDDPSCALNREFCHDMKVWNTLCDKLFIWHYNTNFSAYTLPFPNLKSIGRSVNYFARHHGQGVFMQAAGNGFSTEMSDLRNYVMSRCLWKPGRDSWAEAMEFCRLHYRESAGPIMAYLSDLHAHTQAAGTHPTCFSTESALAITPETSREMAAKFQEAISLAQSDTIRQRVEKASLCAYRAALSGSSVHLLVKDGVCRPDLSGLDPDLLGAYERICKKYSVSMESEGTSTESYLNGLRSFFGGLAAVTIENATWRVVLLPGTNGKLVEMTYKPTGRNVIKPNRAFNRFRYEEWVRSGAGPSGRQYLEYSVDSLKSDSVQLSLTAEDGTRFERTIQLRGDAVRFDTTITAGIDRALDLWVHPEYDAGTASADPRTVRVYVKQGNKIVQANKGWKDALANPEQEGVIKQSARYGYFAMVNAEQKYGVEQRFSPEEFRELALFWGISRQQVNLELIPAAASLRKGQQTHYGYEVRYLSQPPIK